jgi:hypothetical protein
VTGVDTEADGRVDRELLAPTPRPSDDEGTGNEWPKGDVVGDVTNFELDPLAGLEPGGGERVERETGRDGDVPGVEWRFAKTGFLSLP